MYTFKNIREIYSLPPQMKWTQTPFELLPLGQAAQGLCGRGNLFQKEGFKGLQLTEQLSTT